MITAGRVSVNGKIMSILGTRVDPATDEIMVDGKVIGQPAPRTYVLLHKPTGVVSTSDDPQGRPTVVELVKVPARIYPVGRLDYDSEGLLLLTDDGDLAQRLTHPSYEVDKEYHALLDNVPTDDDLREWRTGVVLEDGPTAPAWVECMGPRSDPRGPKSPDP
jgi:23S rRNA pseudouridine2605 synthase